MEWQRVEYEEPHTLGERIAGWFGYRRVKRIFTVREAEFSPQDVADLEAFREHESLVGPHGIPMSEALDPENRGKFKVKVLRDFAQAELDRKRAELQKMKTNDPGYGIRLSVEKI